MGEQCEARHLGVMRCNRVARHRVVAMCVHEHIREVWVCSIHADGGVCRECLNSSRPHECGLRNLSKVTASG